MQAFLITRKNPKNGFTETITHTGYPSKTPQKDGSCTIARDGG